MAGRRRASPAGLLLLLLSLSLLSVLGEAAQMPRSWPRCRRNDPNFDLCLRHAMQLTIPQLAPGVPELDMPAAEPVPLEGTVVLTPKLGRVSLQITLSNLFSYGLTKMKVHSVFSDLDKGLLDMHGKVPVCVMHADMEIEGHILHEPVSLQRGHANFTFYDAEGFFVVSGIVEERDGEEYLRITNSTINVINLGGMSLYFSPLDSSPHRSAQLNYLLNNNALALWTSVRDHLSEAHTTLFQDRANQVFGKVPIKDIFLSDDHPAVLEGPSYVFQPNTL